MPICSICFARPGEVVQAGQVLGTAGQTDGPPGPTLHFELLDRAVRRDPSALLGLPAMRGRAFPRRVRVGRLVFRDPF